MVADRARVGFYLLSFAILALFVEPTAPVAIAAVVLLAVAIVAAAVPVGFGAAVAAGPRTTRSGDSRHGLARQCDPDAAGQVRSRAPGLLA